MSYDTLDLRIDPRGIAQLALNLPEKRNALSAAMIAELTDFAACVSPGMQIRAVILSGQGKIFCAGGDLSWMQAQMTADRQTRMAEARKLAMMLDALNRLPVPLIGAIHGAAMGGGVGMAAVCDVALAATGTRFGLTETRLGLIPATIGPYVLARMGEGRARRVFMSSRLFGTEEAQELGLIARTVPEPDLHAAAMAEAEAYLATAPGAVARAKALARSLGPRIDADTITRSIEALADTWETAEATEGITAFFDKRPPGWTV